MKWVQKLDEIKNIISINSTRMDNLHSDYQYVNYGFVLSYQKRFTLCILQMFYYDFCCKFFSESESKTHLIALEAVVRFFVNYFWRSEDYLLFNVVVGQSLFICQANTMQLWCYFVYRLCLHFYAHDGNTFNIQRI